MLHYTVIATILICAYVLGAIPTALIVSRKIKKVDIRCVGDGNMGAHNTFHEVGPKFGLSVALMDVAKGALAVCLARVPGLDLSWQILAAILAILGHDFPVWANFKGGQGLAVSFGTMAVLFPLAALVGISVYGISFLLVKSSNIAAGTGGAAIALMLGLSQNWVFLAYAIIVLLFVAVKMVIDGPRRRSIGITKIC